MITRRASGTCIGVAVACLGAGAASAQAPTYAFPSGLSSTARQVLVRLADSASAAGIPTDPLVLKVAEGVLKGADEPRILRAARSLLGDYMEVRAALDRDASPLLLTAAVNARRAGVSRSALTDIVGARANDEPAVIAGLVAAADLVTNGVPANRAASAVTELLRRPASEAALLDLRAGVARDVANGGAPDAALGARLNGLLRGVRPPP